MARVLIIGSLEAELGAAARIAAARGAPLSRMVRAASAGMVPIAAIASAASASISNQIR